MRLTGIHLRDFRAFPGELNLALPDGCNLLLHGENGSGKSSLALALREFFTLNPGSAAAPSKNPIGRHEHAFPDPNPTPQPRKPLVKLTFSHPIPGTSRTTDDITWEASKLHPLEIGDSANPAVTTDVQRQHLVAVSRFSGFFDYRVLLRASLAPRAEDLPGQLFYLFVQDLLSGFPVKVGRKDKPLGELWRELENTKPKSRHARRMREANDVATNFNRALNPFLDQIKDKANAFLDHFPNHRMKIVRFDFRGCQFATESKALTGQAIYPEIEFAGRKLDAHGDFLNEARLTALALSTFLAAVSLTDPNPDDPDPLRLLVLDDVLIGLDLNNRLPLLELLRTQFPQHQIVLITHDLVWFEIAKEHTAEWTSSKWSHARLFEEPTGPSDPAMPRFERIKPNQDDLQIAEGHVRAGDLRAAAVYVRAAYENRLKNICEKNGIEVTYKANPKEVKADALWRGILRRHATQTKAKRGEFLDPLLIPRISAVRSAVLNRLSHSGASSLTTMELTAALQAISDLRKTKIPFKP